LNAAILEFDYNSSGSTSNNFGLGFWGASNMVNINGNGQLWVSSTVDTSSIVTGAFTTSGGASVGKTFWVGGGVRFGNTISVIVQFISWYSDDVNFTNWHDRDRISDIFLLLEGR